MSDEFNVKWSDVTWKGIDTVADVLTYSLSCTAYPILNEFRNLEECEAFKKELGAIGEELTISEKRIRCPESLSSPPSLRILKDKALYKRWWSSRINKSEFEGMTTHFNNGFVVVFELIGNGDLKWNIVSGRITDDLQWDEADAGKVEELILNFEMSIPSEDIRFTPKQRDWVCHQISEWYLKWKKEFGDTSRTLAFAKENLKERLFPSVCNTCEVNAAISNSGICLSCAALEDHK